MILLLGFLVALQNPAAQQRDTRTWSQAYVDAQRSIQQRNWEQAIANIEAALRLGAPTPGRSVLFSGDVFREFNPDYLLGVAYSNLGRFAEADRAFERVRQAQLIRPTDAQYKEFTALSNAAKFEVLVGDAQQALAQDRLDDAGASAKSARALGVQGQRLDALEKQIADRRTALAAPPPNQPAPTPAIPINPPGDTTTQTAANTAGTPNPIEQSPIQQSPVQQPPPQAPTPARPPQAAAANVGRPAAAPTPWTPRPGEDERSAMVRFFEGDYASAAAFLRNIVSFGTPSPRTYLYLASSRAALVLTGAAPQTELESARAELALAGDTGRFAADKALISPRVRQALGIQQ